MVLTNDNIDEYIRNRIEEINRDKIQLKDELNKIEHPYGRVQYIFKSVTTNFNDDDYTIITKALDTFTDSRTAAILLLLKRIPINDFHYDYLKIIEISVQQLIGECEIDDIEQHLIVFQKINKLRHTKHSCTVDFTK